jgi:hypothetical protein
VNRATSEGSGVRNSSVCRPSPGDAIALSVFVTNAFASICVPPIVRA